MRVIGFVFLGLISPAHAQLPESVMRPLRDVGIADEYVSVYVQELKEQPATLAPPLLSHQAQRAVNPASTMKLLTSYAGLELLGPAYRWKTEVYYDGLLQSGVLNGDLYIKGYGDPNFMAADLWRLLNSLRQLGLRRVHGDLVIDNSYFASSSASSNSFDGDGYRAYNATPSAFALNLKSTSFRFDSDAEMVRISKEPDLPEITVNNRLQLGNGGCDGWRSQLGYDIRQAGGVSAVTFSGKYPANCTEKYMDLLALDETSYTYHLFRKLWRELGGEFDGKIRQQAVPAQAVRLYQQDSRTLSSLLADLNKWSNNLMARQLLLTIGAEKRAQPASEQDGVAAITRWLNGKGMFFNELVVDNGSGLSRMERFSARNMGEMLVNAYYSPVMPELMSSLPILSVDGTMQKRMKDSPLQGRAHLKTGSINGVVALAGYILGQSGKRYVVVFMVNHHNAYKTRPVQDALLEWVHGL